MKTGMSGPTPSLPWVSLGDHLCSLPLSVPLMIENLRCAVLPLLGWEGCIMFVYMICSLRHLKRRGCNIRNEITGILHYRPKMIDHRSRPVSVFLVTVSEVSHSPHFGCRMEVGHQRGSSRTFSVAPFPNGTGSFPSIALSREKKTPHSKENKEGLMHYAASQLRAFLKCSSCCPLPCMPLFGTPWEVVTPPTHYGSSVTLPLARFR
jgi:hypothetical protein